VATPGFNDNKEVSMSAFQVSSAHIARIVGIADALRRGGVNFSPCPYLDLKGTEPGYTDGDRRIFGHLAAANAASVGYRYNESVEPVPYVAIPRVSLDSMADVVAAIKVIDCYEYQSCEPPGWEESDVCRWIKELHASLLRAIPGFSRAYDAAPWGVA
jgi:hypothetical protein